MNNNIKITQIRSTIGILPKHRKTMLSLGLRRIGHTKIIVDTPSVRGMINLVSYMIKINGSH
ncbi:MAG: 50S ribosomal protein L30 [Candidatus Lightella neohaematopini]|nr:50S ribosomal protein L30 [Candidatus Lightella neohaematopini]MCV2531226.1 50S ribosomal protein L30 [Candidatus Lightella neohaematopini]